MSSRPVTRAPVSQHHAIFLQRVGLTNGLVIPVVYLCSEKGPILFNALIEYHLAFPGRSITWQRNIARAVGLFWDYCIATREKVDLWGAKNPHRRALRGFAVSLLNGTIDAATHKDETKLYWPPSSLNVAKRLTSSLIDFIDWCNDEGIINSSVTKSDIRPSSESSTLTFLRAAIKTKSFSYLSHMKESKTIAARYAARARSKIVSIGVDPRPASDIDVKEFPQDLIAPLLTHGFIINENPFATLEEREDITAKMVTLLLLFGGTRISEPFHLWFNDVIPLEDGKCKVFLRHPSDANTNLQGNDEKPRKAFLLERQLHPRNHNGVSKSYKAGWKGLKLDNSLSAPIFFIHAGAEHIFREMHIYYLRYREGLMALRRQRGQLDHPFLFVSRGTDENFGKDYSGEPYSISSYKKALERALDRLEKRLQIKIPRGKMSGTTPHGFRHWYGRALADCGMETKVIQNCLRHRSPLSQEVYTTPSQAKIMESLNKARDAISSLDIGNAL